ncbi:MAG TPA: branched-chain amino acid ABC transporter permease [Actinomycetes bacterium]|jgi:branched-chain amino acid transport system permease protein|nr:branched-chain amino acid ABC transporter permease [Actinomycetes bacterium]
MTTTAASQEASAGGALARIWSRVRLPLVAAPAGGIVAVAGAYLFWTLRTIQVRGVPVAGDLRNFGFGGVRLYALLLGLVAIVQGALLLSRPSLRNRAQATALGRLGLGLAAVPIAWMFVLVAFNEVPMADIGPGAWVTLAGGVLVWLSARGLVDAPAGPVQGEWPRRSLLADVGVLLVAEVAAFLVFLHGVEVDDPSAFLGYFVALVGLSSALASLGVFKGLAGPLHRVRLVAILIMVALLLLFPLTQSGNTFWVRVAAQAGVLVIAALGLNIVVGSAGLLDLGYVAFVAIGAYTAALTGEAALTSQFGNSLPHIPFLLVLFFVAPLVAALFGVMLGAPTLRLRGDYLAIVTLGFGEIVRITFNNIDPVTRGPNGIASIGDPGLGGWNMSQGLSLGGTSVTGTAVYFYLCLGIIGLVLAVIYRMSASRIGRAWIAIREDEVAAAAMGINTTLTKLLAFGAGAFFAGMAGTVLAHLGTQVSPDSYTFEISVLILAMVVLGGIGNPPGVVLGAIILTFLPEKLRDFSDIRFLIFGIALVLIMRFRPEGLLPSARRRRELHASADEAAAEDQQLFDVRAGA